MSGLNSVYNLQSVEEANALYDGWAPSYDQALTDAGYETPKRCAAALADHIVDRTAPVIEFGCGTGLGGVALMMAGFTCVDGVDLSDEMLIGASKKDVYRRVAKFDLAHPMEEFATASYAHAAAIGVLTPNFLSTTVIDAVLEILPAGGRFVFSLNDHVLAERSFPNHVFELVECRRANLLFREHGPHLPDKHLGSTVYVLEAL